MNEPYKLPNGWKWVRLGEVCEFSSGKFIQKDRVKNKGNFPVYGANGIMGYTDEKIFDSEVIIIGRVGSCGMVNKTQGPSWITDNTIVLKNSPQIMFDFLYYLLKSIKFENLRSASVQPLITQKDLKSVVIPLPPLPDQKRIAEKLREIMSEIEKARTACEKQLEAVKALPSAYLREVFESEEAKKWERRGLGEFFEFQQGVAMSPKRRLGISPKPFLRTLNVLWGKIDLSNLDKMDFTDEEVEKLALKPGDLLVCEGGEVGRAAVWNGEIDVCLHQNHVHRLRKLRNDLIPEFYMYWMQAAFQVFKLYSGQASTTTIPNLSIGRLKLFLVPFPPLPIQHRIANYLKQKMAEVDKLKQAIEKQLEIINALPQSYLRRAFRGEL